MCREVTLSGATLWETPGNLSDTSETGNEAYHHSFTKLPSGNYLVLGKAFIDRTLTAAGGTVSRIPVSLIIEYNPKGDTVWTWNSHNYVTDTDIVQVGQKVFRGNTFGHMNWVFEDAEGTEVYACFRDLNAIVVIDKKTRKVARTYGDKIPTDKTKQAIGFFKKQHSPVLLPDGRILVFNNNEPGKQAVSSVQIFTQGRSEKDTSKIVWSFNCDFDTLMPGFASRMGNALPLAGNSYLVNMGTVARLFEVTTDKQVVWDCLPEVKRKDAGEWRPEPNYRMQYVSSLYPCYFTVSLHTNATSKPEIIIFNEGSEADAYRIEVAPVNKGSKTKVTTTTKVQAHNNYAYALSLTDKVIKRGFTVSVTSLLNRDLVRTRTYSYP